MKNRSWDQTIWYSDMSYVRRKIKWKPVINLKNGLLKTVEWHKNIIMKNHKKNKIEFYIFRS